MVIYIGNNKNQVYTVRINPEIEKILELEIDRLVARFFGWRRGEFLDFTDKKSKNLFICCLMEEFKRKVRWILEELCV